MKKLYYDLHIHSCLSPCGDNDMTPNNIAGMSKLNGINIAALTDHNSTLNCPAFFAAAERYEVTPVAGMELTTAEDIHMVCLFETLEAAMDFGSEISRRRVLIPNKPAIFGEQLILDSEDEPVGSEKYLLPNAVNITIDEAVKLSRDFGGVCWPAHVDRDSNGIIAALGTFPEELDVGFAEFNRSENIEKYRELYPALKKKAVVVSSDAHYLESLRDASEWFELGGETDEEIRKELFEKLRQGVMP